MGEFKFPCWDPVLWDLPGPFDLRWYGLMYVVGFLVGHHILTRLSSSGFFPLAREKVGDLIFALIFGVVLGGRLGYVCFYPKGSLFENPLAIFKIWEGGLSFHGGLIGVAIALIWFARRNKVPVLRMVDCGALAVTPGIFCVRMANFINSELFGRVTDKSVPWAMQFPRDSVAEDLMHLRRMPGIRSIELAIQYACDRTKEAWDRLLEQAGTRHHAMLESIKDDLDWENVMPLVPLRHPSQLYAGLTEGVLTGLVLLFFYRLSGGKLRPGMYGAAFLLCYGTLRFYLEFYRQPDEHMFQGGFLWGWITMGQILCIAMLVAAVLLWRGARRGPTPAAQQEPAS